MTAMGVPVVPVTLHTGVSSLDASEPPYPERFRVPGPTATVVNEARRRGSRVIAVGTTTVRALETVASLDGYVHGGEGWTSVVVTPDRGIQVVDAMLTGFHAPRASHLAMLEAMAGWEHLVIAYRAALRHRYLWHEFGDVHLVLGGATTTAQGPPRRLGVAYG
jgi:S-adenosylmethionine:tRNA ribosyltransferase-isomerase